MRELSTYDLLTEQAIRRAVQFCITVRGMRPKKAEEIAHKVVFGIIDFYFQYGVWSPVYGTESKLSFFKHLNVYTTEALLKELHLNIA